MRPGDSDDIEIIISFRTRRRNELDQVLKRMAMFIALVKNKPSLEEKEKIPFDDFALLRDFAALDEWHSYLNHDPELNTQIGHCKHIVHFLENYDVSNQAYKPTIFMEISSSQTEKELTHQFLEAYFLRLKNFLTTEATTPSKTFKSR